MKLSPNQRIYRSICSAVRRADEADEKFKDKARFLAEIEAGFSEREWVGEIQRSDARWHKRIVKKLQRQLIRLEAKKAELTKECLASFEGYRVVPDLISRRDLDLPHQWRSISGLRAQLSRPLLGNLSAAAIDKWQQQVLASYSDQQIDEQIRALGPRRLEGIRINNGATEYLLP